MALYVHPENQQLLWGLINTNPHMSQIFSKYHPSQNQNGSNQLLKVSIIKINIKK